MPKIVRVTVYKSSLQLSLYFFIIHNNNFFHVHRTDMKVTEMVDSDEEDT
jgi:hypothetical protein